MTEQPQSSERQRALLVGVDRTDDPAGLADRLEELALLAETALCDSVGTITQARRRPDPKTYLGKGKAQELKLLIESLDAEVVIVDAELTPAQQRNLEKELERTVVDRTQLILDIFARRAKTHLARWEVELAQLGVGSGLVSFYSEVCEQNSRSGEGELTLATRPFC